MTKTEPENKHRNSTNYATMLRRTRAALARGGVLRALVWYQGESDSTDEADAVAYKGRLVKLFNHFRRDLHSPSLPIIQVALASGLEFKGVIRQVQLQLKHYHKSKCIHLSTRGQVQLGKMLADAFLRF